MICSFPRLCLAILGAVSYSRIGHVVCAGVAVGPSLALLEPLRAHFGEDWTPEKRLQAIEALLRPDFDVRPEKTEGRITLEAARIIVRNYFLKEHGWVLSGLEPLGISAEVVELRGLPILRTKAAPVAEALSELHESDLGLSIGDVGGVVAAIERIVLQRCKSLLEEAYALNDLESKELVDEEALHELLRSHLLLFRRGGKTLHGGVNAHRAMKARAASAPGKSWKELVGFEEGVVASFVANDGRKVVMRSAGPGPTSSARRFSFEEAMQMMESLALGYGRWQDRECKRMKLDLMQLDPDGSGSIPFEAFQNAPPSEDYGYAFTESLDYLQRIGALEEGAQGASQQRVLVANYLTGPTNCIASSNDLSVCCLNECAGIVTALERQVRAPEAPAQELLDLTARLPSTSVPTKVSAQALVDELNKVAEDHGGVVPLYSAGFAQWLHSAFPYECPLPQVRQLEQLKAEERNASTSHPLQELLGKEGCTRLPTYEL